MSNPPSIYDLADFVEQARFLEEMAHLAYTAPKEVMERLSRELPPGVAHPGLNWLRACVFTDACRNYRDLSRAANREATKAIKKAKK